ncbi:hypothetical protein FRC09_004865, partial [Ceratobasidium sp. 395]
RTSTSSAACEAIRILQEQGFVIQQPALVQAAHLPAQQQPLQQGLNNGEDLEEDLELGEEEKAPGTSRTRKHGVGKAHIITFPKEEQPTITTMVVLARACLLADGMYDNNKSTLYKPYWFWPKEWKPHETRHKIMAQSLMQVCKENCLDAELPCIPWHVQASSIAVTTMRTFAMKALKPVVDQHFGFTLEESNCNKQLSSSLLPLNLVYKDVPGKKHPLQNNVLFTGCPAVGFSKRSAIGACHCKDFKGIPQCYLAFVTTMINFVLFRYGDGEYQDPKLNADLQASTFWQSLRFLIETQQKQRKTLTDNVHNPSPLSECKWSPDTDKVIPSQVDLTVNMEIDKGAEMEQLLGDDD